MATGLSQSTKRSCLGNLSVDELRSAVAQVISSEIFMKMFFYLSSGVNHLGEQNTMASHIQVSYDAQTARTL